MDCRHTEQQLSNHLEGRLGRRETETIGAHLEQCPACRRRRDAILAVEATLRDLPELPLPEGARSRVIDRWLAERRSPLAGWRSRWLVPARPDPLSVLAAAALLLAALGLGLARWRATAQSQGRSSSPVIVSSPAAAPPSQPATGFDPGRRTRSEPPAAGPAHPGIGEPPGSRVARAPWRGLIGAAQREEERRALLTGLPSSLPERAPQGGRTAAPRSPAPVTDDLAYMNLNPQAVIREWTRVGPDEWDRIEAHVRGSVPVRDDFVQIPFPRIAAASPRLIAEAVDQYKKEAAIVDPRLARDVTLAVKAMSFSDLCDRLRADTGIKITAGPSVADEKVTIFCEDRPLREVMREITHVFGFTWLRSQASDVRRQALEKNSSDTDASRLTPDASFRYELEQDLKSQLAEEELRNQDFHAALVALDQQLTTYHPFLAVPPDTAPMPVPQRVPRRKRANEEERIQTSAGPVWGPAAVYFRLSPAQRALLWSGDTLDFNNLVTDPERALPADVAQQMLQTAGAANIPGTVARVSLRLDRSERGQVLLQIWPIVQRPNEGRNLSPYAPQAVMAQCPSVRKPDNAADNQSLAQQPAFQREVSIKPSPSCPWFDPKRRPARDDFRMEIGGRTVYADADGRMVMGSATPHVSSADVWEAVHRATGLDIVADSYTRAYPATAVTVEGLPLFDALCQIGDSLGVRWKTEDRFLLCRSASYFWDRLIEVPNRVLVRWQEDRKRDGGLPFEDLLEIASLSDQQLAAATNSFVIEHCWGIEEWSIVSSNGPLSSVGQVVGSYLRPYARFLAALTPGEREQVLRPEGLLVSSMTRPQQIDLTRTILSVFSDLPERLPQLRMHVDYVPAAGYLWHPAISDMAAGAAAGKWPVVSGKSLEATLAAARRYQPAAQPSDIRPSLGALNVALLDASGPVWQYGGPAVMLRNPAPPPPSSGAAHDAPLLIPATP